MYWSLVQFDYSDSSTGIGNFPRTVERWDGQLTHWQFSPNLLDRVGWTINYNVMYIHTLFLELIFMNILLASWTYQAHREFLVGV